MGLNPMAQRDKGEYSYKISFFKFSVPLSSSDYYFKKTKGKCQRKGLITKVEHFYKAVGSIWEISVSSAQLFCEPNGSKKKKSV